MSNESSLWIARLPCGCVVAALSTLGIDRSEVAQEIGEWLLEGYAVETLDAKSVTIGGCPHGRITVKRVVDNA